MKRKSVAKSAFVFLFIAIMLMFLACNNVENVPQSDNFTVSYAVSNGGSISGKASQTVAHGKNAEPVTAVPHEGYNFIEWSDGVTNPLRHDTNITAAITVTAQFERIFYDVTYIEGIGGHIQFNYANQTVAHGDNARSVTAVPHEGYNFIEWSDGITTATRHDTNITAAITVTAQFQRITNGVTYTALEGGSISGKASQTVAHGENAEPVTAVANAGYNFIQWSDGITTATRHDTNIKSALNLTAEFEKITQITFDYIFSSAIISNPQASITLDYGEIQSAAFTVPQRENFIFNGWYLDSDFAVQVTDELGNARIGDEIFYSGASKLYAKWTPVRVATYKILIVFVTEFSATLEVSRPYFMADPSEYVMTTVDYKMTETERQICELSVVLLTEQLNRLLEDTVIFEIDYYFTTETLGAEHISRSFFLRNEQLESDYSLWATRIPEVSDILDDYQSVITVFSMNDYANLLRSAAGLGGNKYACIYLETFFHQMIYDNIPIETLLDLTNPYALRRWNYILSLYTHEFTHTVELMLKDPPQEFHKATAEFLVTHGYGLDGGRLEVYGLYLRYEATLNGERAGIPNGFWHGEVEIKPPPIY